MIKELIDVKEGKSYVPFFHINDLETTFDYLCTYLVKHFTPTSVEYCRINLYSMSWQTRKISWLIVAIFCHNPASYMLEFDFYVLILHLTSSCSCVNNLMHILANHSCDSRAVSIDMTRDFCIILFMRSLLKLSHELYLHLHMRSLLSLLNMRSILYLLCMCSLLKCEYLFCNSSLSLFVILRLELHVVTFIFCEINDIYVYVYINIQWHWSWNRSLFSELYISAHIKSSKWHPLDLSAKQPSSRYNMKTLSY